MGNTEKKEQQYKGLVAFDLDHTLLDHQTWKITPSALRAIRKLKANGYCIVIASGRDMHSRHAQPYGEQVAPDALVHMNGTRVETEGMILIDRCMDKPLLERVLEYAQEHEYALGAEIGGVDYFTFPDAITAYDLDYWGSSDRHFADVYGLLELPVRALAFAGTPEEVEDLQNAFPELKVLMFAAKRGADVFEAGYSKADGIRALCRHYHIDMAHTWAFGDSYNDREMLEAVGTGIAMGNAVPAIRETADYVTDPIDQDGIWNACRHFGLI